jgi:hypothetical protein
MAPNVLAARIRRTRKEAISTREPAPAALLRYVSKSNQTIRILRDTEVRTAKNTTYLETVVVVVVAKFAAVVGGDGGVGIGRRGCGDAKGGHGGNNECGEFHGVSEEEEGLFGSQL